MNKSRERKRKKEEGGGRSIELKRISLSLSPRVAMPSCRVTCRSFSSLGRNKCVHPSILPCNNPFRLICSNVACSGSRYPMNRSVCTLFYQLCTSTKAPVSSGTHFTGFGGRGGGGGDVRGGGCRQTPLFFREKRINKYIYILAITPTIQGSLYGGVHGRKRDIIYTRPTFPMGGNGCEKKNDE